MALIGRLRELTPPRLRPLVVRVWFGLRPLVRRLFSGTTRHCPVCNSWSRWFLAHGNRPDVVCPVCLLHDRHRLAWIFLRSRTALGHSPHRLLHLAPEFELQRRLRRLPGVRYWSADLDSPYADQSVDLTRMTMPAAAYDAIYCSHVLEHVEDDRAAIEELHRVLRPQGWALIQVPIGGATTLEDRSIVSRVDRQRLYLGGDHCRLYGLDLADRLRDAGFSVSIHYGRDLMQPEEVSLWGINPYEPLFLATRPA